MRINMRRTGHRFKLAVLAPHPIQYQAPLFRALASSPGIDLHVFFCSRIGAQTYLDPDFQVQLSWDIPLLEGYNHTFLTNLNPRPRPSRLGLMNPGIVTQIFSQHFDAVLINGWALTSNWMAWGAATIKKVPVLLRCESNGLNEPTGPKLVAKRTLLRMMFTRVAGFLAIGTRNLNFYRSYDVPQQRIFWTPFTVDNDFFQRQAYRLTEHKRALREREGIATDLPLILFCGKLTAVKRVLDVLRAVSALDGKPSVSIAFVGDGPLRSEITQYAQARRLSNVYCLGFRNQTEIASCYAMADVLVLPSSVETWGLVVNEAMCFGLPIIASDQVGAAVDLVRDGENGFVYPVGDVSALSDCLRHVLSNDAKRIEMGQRSMEIINNWKIEHDLEGFQEAIRFVAGTV